MAILGTILAATQLAVGVGSAILSHKEQADAAETARREAQRALRLAYRDLSIRAMEETTAARQSLLMARRQAGQLRGTARASAAEAGVAGRSADAILADISRGEGEYTQSVQNNLVITLDQIQRLREAAESEAQTRISQYPRPSLLGTALRIGEAGLSFADFMYRNYRIPGEEAPNG